MLHGLPVLGLPATSLNQIVTNVVTKPIIMPIVTAASQVGTTISNAFAEISEAVVLVEQAGPAFIDGPIGLFYIPSNRPFMPTTESVY